jgi:hypothetical protein
MSDKLTHWRETIAHVRLVQDYMLKVCELLEEDAAFQILVWQMATVGERKESNMLDLLWELEQHLFENLLIHDASKFSVYEWKIFATANNNDQLAGLTYGSPEYFQQIRDYLAPALEHHYSHNPHHPEFWDGTLNKMPLRYLIEMLCDWLAATQRHKDGDIWKSLIINKGRFDYDNHTYNQFYKFIMYLI